MIETTFRSYPDLLAIADGPPGAYEDPFLRDVDGWFPPPDDDPDPPHRCLTFLAHMAWNVQRGRDPDGRTAGASVEMMFAVARRIRPYRGAEAVSRVWCFRIGVVLAARSVGKRLRGCAALSLGALHLPRVSSEDDDDPTALDGGMRAWASDAAVDRGVGTPDEDPMERGFAWRCRLGHAVAAPMQRAGGDARTAEGDAIREMGGRQGRITVMRSIETRLPDSPNERGGNPTSGVHPTMDQLIAFVDGELRPADASMIDEHIAECRVCARYVAAVHEADRLIQAWRREVPPPASLRLPPE